MIKKIKKIFVIIVAVILLAGLWKTAEAFDLSGYFWGGSEDGSFGAPGVIDGNETGVGWIKLSGPNYAVIVPPENDEVVRAVTGYAWSENLGWIDFNPYGNDNLPETADDHCTTGVPNANQYKATDCSIGLSATGCSWTGVFKSSGNLTGCARIVSIAEAEAENNSGGWSGWLKFDYGINKNYAWNGESAPISPLNMAEGLGWVDLRYTYECTGSDPSNATLCLGDSEGLSMDTLKTSVENCSDPPESVKCEYKCNEGLGVIGGLCSYPVPPCSGDCSNAPNVCIGVNFPNSCGTGTCPGEKDCSWQEVLP